MLDLTSPQVVLLKLSSGETLFARVSLAEDGRYEVRKPVTIAQTAEGLGLRPWLPFHNASQPVFISKIHVICVAEIDDQFRNSYTEAVGEGVVLASKGDARAIDSMTRKLANKRGK